jgi:hypothetical protein
LNGSRWICCVPSHHRLDHGGGSLGTLLTVVGSGSASGSARVSCAGLRTR